MEISEFILSCEAGGLSARTIRWYGDQLCHFVAWWGSRSGWPVPGDVRMFLADERRRGVGAASLSARFRALSAFSGWAARAGLCASFVVGVRRPKVERRPPRRVEFHELAALLGTCVGDRWIDARDRALLQVLFWCGLRVSELCALRVSDVDLRRKLLTVQRGKGGKGRIVPIPAALAPDLLSYLFNRPKVDGSLWLSDDGSGGVRGVLGVSGVQQMLKRRCALAGLRSLNPHAFRHGFATAFLNAGADMSAVQKILGHSDVRVTADVYAEWLTEGLQREYDEVERRLRGVASDS